MAQGKAGEEGKNKKTNRTNTLIMITSTPSFVGQTPLARIEHTNAALHSSVAEVRGGNGRAQHRSTGPLEKEPRKHDRALPGAHQEGATSLVWFLARLFIFA